VMHSTIFPEYFRQLAGLTGGVPKLRSLILDFAFRGNLVPQNPADEPVSELLKRIETQMEHLVRTGELRNPLLPIEETEGL